MSFKKGTRLSGGVKFTPNEDYWSEVEIFWNKIKDIPALREDLRGGRWSTLSLSQRRKVADLFKVWRSMNPLTSAT